MAFLSPEARVKARQIREMSRQFNSNNSVVSSTGSQHGTISADTTQSTDFDPIRDDAQMSTGLIEKFAGNQPRLRDTARKYNRWVPRRSDDTGPTFAINTSAIKGAFEGFESGPIVYNDHEFSLDLGSMEIGRGPKTSQRQGARSPTRAPLAEFSSNVDTQTIDTINDGAVQVAYTPTSRPTKPTRKVSRDKRPQVLSGIEKSARWFDQNMRPNSPNRSTQIIPSSPPIMTERQSSPFFSAPLEDFIPVQTETRRYLPDFEDQPGSRFGQNTGGKNEHTSAKDPKESLPKAYNGSPYVSNASITINDDRRTLAKFHAQVADESECSILSQRPSNVPENKNARFTKTAFQQNPSVEKKSSLFPEFRAQGTVPDEQLRLKSKDLRTYPKTPVPQAGRHDINQKLQRSHTSAVVDFTASTNNSTEYVNGAANNFSQLNNDTTPNQTQYSFALPQQWGDVSKLVSQKPMAITQTRIVKGRSFSADNTTSRIMKGKPKDLIDHEDQEEEVDIYWKCKILQKKLGTFQDLRHDDQILIRDLENDRAALTAELEALEREKEEGFRKDSGVGGVGSFSSNDGIRDVHFSELCQQKEKLEADVKIFRERLTESREAALAMEAKLETKLSKRESENAKLVEERDEIKFRLEAAVRQLERALQDVEHLKGDNKELLACNETLQQNINVLEDDVRVLKGEISRIAVEGSQSKAERKALSVERETFQTEKKAWLTEKESMRREVEGTRKDLASAREEMAQFQEEYKECSKLWVQKSREWVSLETSLKKKITRQTTAIRKYKGVKNPASCPLGQRVVNPPEYEDSISSASEVGDIDTTHESNFSDIFGHGFMAQLYAKRDAAKAQNQKRSTEANKDMANKLESMRSDASALDAKTDGTRNSLRSVYDQENDTLPSVKSARVQRDETVLSIDTARSGQDMDSDEDEMPSPGSVRSARFGRNLIHEEDTMHSVGSARSIRSYHSTKETTKQAEVVRPGILKKTGKDQVLDVNTRRKSANDELTSAFIIPDIIGITREGAHPVLSSTARDVLDSLCQHNAQNCTVCTRVAIYENKAESNSLSKIHVEKAVPVSKRMPITQPYEDEPTLRPSVAPDFALNSVIKVTKDELYHLKAKHVQLLNKYNSTDASLGKRARKELIAGLREVSIARDTKEDMLYSLYDVLEGRKSVSEEDLPWEGIEESE